MTPSPKIKKLIEVSKKVLKDCALENGAIVAANSDKPYYTREAADYHYVWPRDAAFISVAADLLKLPIQEPFFDWLYIRPEDFKKDKLLYSNYSSNGRFGSFGKMFQPDQMGTVLWAIHHHYRHDLKQAATKYKDLIERMANGLCAVWNKNYFTPNTCDLWEGADRQTSTRIENNFTYSLAACGRGLLSANEIIPTQLWREEAMQMLVEINEAYDEQNKYFYRNRGKISDKNVDASLLGLVYPFRICDPNDPKMLNTVKKIEEKIVVAGGVHRYENDYYDGEGGAGEGGGAWPVLNFLMAIYWKHQGNLEKAHHYYTWVLDKIDKTKDFLPEQVFDDFRIGVYPLAWSHAMFVVASHELGYL